MAESTEAACLLQSGTMYRARVGLVDGPSRVFVGLKPGGFSVYRDDAPIFHFDLEGRWQRAFVDGVHYLKGLDATVRAVDRGREGVGMVLRRRTLGQPEVVALDESIREAARILISRLEANGISLLAPPSSARAIGLEELRELLRLVSRWDALAWSSHRALYEATYGPWPFLPPDCPNPIIFQATRGREFGGRNSGAPQVLNLDAFERHAGAVVRLLGRRVDQGRDVFLAGSAVLRQPIEMVLGYLSTIQSCLPESLGGPGQSKIYACLDEFGSGLPGAEGWTRLRSGGLGRLTLGIESGDPETRAQYGKTWRDDELRSTLGDLKAAEMAVCLVILVGAGAPSSADREVDATSRLVGTLPLDPGDLVTLVEAASLGDASEGSGPQALGTVDVRIQELRRQIGSARASKGPRVVAYNPVKRWA